MKLGQVKLGQVGQGEIKREFLSVVFENKNDKFELRSMSFFPSKSTFLLRNIFTICNRIDYVNKRRKF